MNLFLNKRKRKRYVLELAQSFKRTINGDIINQSKSRLTTFQDFEEIKKTHNNTNSFNLDFLVVLSPPFSSMDKIVDYLYLSGVGSLTKENFSKFKIKLVVNVTHDLPLLNEKNVDTIRVPINDSVTEDAMMYFDDVSDLIQEYISKKENVLVHCLAGVSRSATFIMAYLIQSKKMNIQEAFRTTRQARPIIRPNIAFIGQLMAYDDKINGTCTSRIKKIFYNGFIIRMPDFYETEYPDLYNNEFDRQIYCYSKNSVISQFASSKSSLVDFKTKSSNTKSQN